MEAQEKILTRQEQIEDFQAEYDRRKAREAELGKQLSELVKSLQMMDKIKKQEIEKTLDSLPDATPKGIVDKVLQLPDEKRGQLLGNIEKLKIAIANENRKAKEAHDEIDRLKNGIRQEEINQNTRETFSVFEGFLKRYKETRDFFFGVLVPRISGMYDQDPYFFRRADALKLNKNIEVSIQSHFRKSEHLSMEEAVEKIIFMGDVQNTGKPLLSRTEGGSTWPEDVRNKFFGFQKSDRKD